MKTIICGFLVLSSCAHLQNMTNRNLLNSSSPSVISTGPQYTELEKCEKNILDADGKNTCDLVVYKTITDFPEIYKMCLKNSKKKSDCDTAYGSTLISRLKVRYPSADFEKINLWCQSEPIVCNLQEIKGQTEFEMKMRESDFYRRSQAVAQAQQQEADASLERRMKRATIYNALVPKNCTSTKDYYGVVHTNCN